MKIFIMVVVGLIVFNVAFVLLKAKAVYKKNEQKLDKPNLLKLKKYN